MKIDKMSRSQLFLIELIIVILFFAFACTITLQVFVKASMLANRTSALNGGMMAAQSAAETDKNTPLDELDPDGYTLYYNDKWGNTSSSDAVYQVTSEIALEDRWAGVMANFTYTVTSEEDIIYQLESKKYFSGEALLPAEMDRGEDNE